MTWYRCTLTCPNAEKNVTMPWTTSKEEVSMDMFTIGILSTSIDGSKIDIEIEHSEQCPN
jgi:hypothetical protein